MLLENSKAAPQN